MNKTYYYESEVLRSVIVLAINSERRSALHDAVKNIIDNPNEYGKKVKYADGVTRYRWERQPYVDILEKIDKLKESDDTVEFFSGGFCCITYALKKYADQNPVCAEMLQEIEEAKQNPLPERVNHSNLR